MGPIRLDGVVVLAPLPDEDFRLLQAVEDLPVEQLVPQLIRNPASRKASMADLPPARCQFNLP